MRTVVIIATFPLFATACFEGASAADPGDVLVDFAGLMADDVMDAIWDGLEAEGVELWFPESGSHYTGQLSLPTGDEGGLGLDGELTVDWALDFEMVDELEGIARWDWQFVVDIDRLNLMGTDVAGSGAWTVASEYYDYHNHRHGFEGQLSIDGDELMDVEYEAFQSGNLHWVRGSIGDVEVDWANPDADLC